MKKDTVRDLKGQKFGKLLVLEQNGWYIHNNARNQRSAKWKCICDCGKIKTILRSALTSGHSKSCGCSRIEKNRKPIGENAKHVVYLNYQISAKKRNLEWNLTKEEFTKLTQSNCQYCNIEPKQERKPPGAYGSYIYNGIDRIDSLLGYVIENCVPCCFQCNQAKMDYSLEEFKKWLLKVVKNMRLIDGIYSDSI